MKKEEFLILLLARLIERGVPEETAKKETEHVRTYLTESGMEELDISLDEMADGIISMLGDSNETEKATDEIIIPIVPAPEPEEGSVSDELEAAIAAIDSNTETAATEDETPQFVEIPIVLEPVVDAEESAQILPESEITENEVPVIETEDPISEPTLIPEPEFDEPAEEPVIESVPAPLPDPIPEPIADPIPEPISEPIPEPAQPPAPTAPVPTDDDDDEEVEEYFPYDKKKKMKNTFKKML